MTENPSLRVLLATASSGSDGGGELYLVGLAEGLKTQGHQVDAILADHPRMDKLAQFLTPWANVYRMPYVNTYDRRLRSIGAVLDRRLIRRLRDRFQELRPDVIHINKQNVEDGLDLVLAAAKSGLPFVSTIHITRHPANLGAVGGRLRGWIARLALRRAGSPCLTIARACAGQLAAEFKAAVPPGKIHCVPNGVRDVPASERRAVRREWGCEDADIVLGCTARIESQKNPLFLVGLLPDLPEHVRLVWVGDGKLHGQMLETAEQLGVRHRVLIDGWRTDGRQRVAGFDLFVLPSHYEGLPLALLEAMAAGLPCVASDVDGTRETIVHGEGGFLCPAGDRDSWLGCLRTLISSVSCRTRTGMLARKRYLEQFSLDTMTRQTIEVYRKVISEAWEHHANSPCNRQPGPRGWWSALRGHTPGRSASPTWP